MSPPKTNAVVVKEGTFKKGTRVTIVEETSDTYLVRIPGGATAVLPKDQVQRDGQRTASKKLSDGTTLNVSLHGERKVK